MKANELIKRTRSFAIGCVNLADSFPNTRLGNHIQGQLIRCSTSVASNYRATRLAQSRAAFIAKMSIVIEEADESEFWTDIALEFNLVNKKEALPLKQEANEIASIFIAARKTMHNQKSKKS